MAAVWGGVTLLSMPKTATAVEEVSALRATLVTAVEAEVTVWCPAAFFCALDDDDEAPLLLCPPPPLLLLLLLPPLDD